MNDDTLPPTPTPTATSRPLPPTTREWWQQTCPGCAYDLTGLPLDRACPECGYEMDETTIVLYGERYGQMPAWVLAAMLGYFAVHTYVLVRTGAAPIDPRVGLLIALVLLGIAVTVLLRARYNRRIFSTKEGRMQVVISRRGVTSRHGPGPSEPIAWPRIERYGFRRFYRWQLNWKRRDEPSWVVQLSSGAILDPSRLTGSRPAPYQRGRVYIGLVLNATPTDAARLEERINALFKASRAAASDA